MGFSLFFAPFIGLKEMTIYVLNVIKIDAAESPTLFGLGVDEEEQTALAYFEH